LHRSSFILPKKGVVFNKLICWFLVCCDFFFARDSLKCFGAIAPEPKKQRIDDALIQSPIHQVMTAESRSNKNGFSWAQKGEYF